MVNQVLTNKYIKQLEENTGKITFFEGSTITGNLENVEKNNGLKRPSQSKINSNRKNKNYM